MLYYYSIFKSRSYSEFVWFLVASFGFTQAGFGLICIVVFTFYKTATLDQVDDMNVEYPTSITATYDWAFWFMVINVIFSLVAAIINYMNHRKMKSKVIGFQQDFP